jgi:hypothetical protein
VNGLKPISGSFDNLIRRKPTQGSGEPAKVDIIRFQLSRMLLKK